MSKLDVAERIIPGTTIWNLSYEEHKQRYQFVAPYCIEKKVLDAACGVGYGSYILAQQGAKQVMAVDISQDAIEYAKSHFSHPAIQFSVQDCQALTELDDKFDVVVSFETIEHLPQPKRFIEQVSHVLNPGGIFICSTPNKNITTDNNPYHISELYLDEFENLMQNNFIVLEKYGQAETESFIRYLRLRSTLFNLSTSRSYIFFERLRHILGLPNLIPPRSEFPRDAVQGDYAINPLDETDPRQKVYILVSKLR